MILNFIIPIGFGIGAFLTTYLIKLIRPYFNIINIKNIAIYYDNAYNNRYGEVKNLPKFTFAQFLNFYNLNPEKWDIFDEDNKIVLPAHNLGKLNEYSYYEHYQPIFFTNIFEYKKYRDWANAKLDELKKKKALEQKKKTLEQKKKAEKTILEAVQKDMNAVQQTEDELTKIINNSNYNFSNNYIMTNNGESYIERTYCGVESNGQRVRIVKQYKIDENGCLRDLGIRYYDKSF